MAHELDITDGTASFASAKQDAWHRLGTVLEDVMTAQEALDAAHLSGGMCGRCRCSCTPSRS